MKSAFKSKFPINHMPAFILNHQGAKQTPKSHFLRLLILVLHHARTSVSEVKTVSPPRLFQRKYPEKNSQGTCEIQAKVQIYLYTKIYYNGKNI